MKINLQAQNLTGKMPPTLIQELLETLLLNNLTGTITDTTGHTVNILAEDAAHNSILTTLQFTSGQPFAIEIQSLEPDSPLVNQFEQILQQPSSFAYIQSILY